MDTHPAKPLNTARTTFFETAGALARNPLGIIALFIVLIYGFASLTVGFSSRLEASERLPVIWFLVTFPVLVLIVFAWLVSRHHAKLYAPADYRLDQSFIEASVHQVEMAAALGAAAAGKRPANEGASPARNPLEKRVTASRVAKFVTPKTLQAFRSRRILWVDDQPNGDQYEREALEALGFSVALARSTEEAMEAVRRERFDVIVSDLSRPPDNRAGLTLLGQLKAEGVKTPYFIYSDTAAGIQTEAWKRGATGVTGRPEELMLLVLETVTSELRTLTAA